jgi:hypothetical protein
MEMHVKVVLSLRRKLYKLPYFTPTKTSGNMMGLYVLILSFLDTIYLAGCKDVASLHYNI